jgi:hypothetical protein
MMPTTLAGAMGTGPMLTAIKAAMIAALTRAAIITAPRRRPRLIDETTSRWARLVIREGLSLLTPGGLSLLTPGGL